MATPLPITPAEVRDKNPNLIPTKKQQQTIQRLAEETGSRLFFYFSRQTPPISVAEAGREIEILSSKTFTNLHKVMDKDTAKQLVAVAKDILATTDEYVVACFYKDAVTIYGETPNKGVSKGFA